MRNRQTIMKIWFGIFLSLTLISIYVAEGISSKDGVIVFNFLIIGFGTFSLLCSYFLGYGNLESPFSLSRGRVYKILESHQITSRNHNIENKCYIVRVENERHEDLWFEFKGELPPQYFTLIKEDGKKKSIPAADW